MEQEKSGEKKPEATFSLESCSSLLLPKIRTSSIKQSTPSSPASIVHILFWKCSGALKIPKGNLLKQKRPNGVMKVVSNLDCGDKGICQNPLLASNFENIFAPVNCARVSSTRGNGCISLCTHLLRGFRSTHIRMDLFCFGTTTIPAHHSVDWSTFDITPISSIRFNSCCTFLRNGSGTCLGEKIA